MSGKQARRWSPGGAYSAAEGFPLRRESIRHFVTFRRTGASTALTRQRGTRREARRDNPTLPLTAHSEAKSGSRTCQVWTFVRCAGHFENEILKKRNGGFPHGACADIINQTTRPHSLVWRQISKMRFLEVSLNTCSGSSHIRLALILKQWLHHEHGQRWSDLQVGQTLQKMFDSASFLFQFFIRPHRLVLKLFERWAFIFFKQMSLFFFFFFFLVNTNCLWSITHFCQFCWYCPKLLDYLHRMQFM